jgi:hypothetical protein
MKMKTKKYKGIALEYGLIDNVEEYVDVDIYIDLPNGEQYLARVYVVVGEDGIIGPTYRYAENSTHDYGMNDAQPPKIVRNALESIWEELVEIINEERIAREAKRIANSWKKGEALL